MQDEFPEDFTLPDPDPEWAPAHFTRPRSPFTRGDEVSAFAAALMTVPADEKAGEPLELMEWQQWLMNALLEEDPETGKLRYRRVLIGVPRKNGKSLIGAALALFFLVFSRRGDQIFTAAKSARQAGIIFKEAKDQVLRSEYLMEIITVRHDELINKETGAIFRALAADPANIQGLNPTVVIADELHAWSSIGRSTKGEEMWAALNEGSANRTLGALLVAITTAGARKDTLCGKLYDNGVKIAAGDTIDDSFGFFWWEASEQDDPLQESTWKKANPNYSCGLMNPADFISSAKMATSIDFSDFLRYKLNMWVRLRGQDFISLYHWENATRPGVRIPPGTRIAVGFDGAKTDDCTGFVIISLEGESAGQMELAYYWEKPEDEENYIVPRHEVNAAVDSLFEDYEVEMLYADKAYYGADSRQWAMKHSGKVMAFNAGVARMAPMAREWLQDVFAGDITHSGDERFTKHVMNAVLTDKGIPWKERKDSPHKIDYLYAAILANGARQHALALDALND